MTIMFAIDPGTGVNSACGIAVIKQTAVGNELLHLEDIWPKFQHKSTINRIKDIVDQVEEQMGIFYERSDSNEFVVSIESFVMRGKGGETLQRFIGAVLTRVPTTKTKVIEIQNTTMKKFVGGTGKADKNDVLKKVLIEFPANRMLLEAAVRKQYDSIDAIGIGLTALDQVKRGK